MARESHHRWLQEISDGRNDRVFRFALPGYILSLLPQGIGRKEGSGVWFNFNGKAQGPDSHAVPDSIRRRGVK